MTFSVALRGRDSRHSDFVPQVLTGLCLALQRHSAELWENQPLNVLVEDICRRRCLDPRHSSGHLFPVTIVDHSGQRYTCQLDPTGTAGLSSDELRQHVEFRLAQRTASQGPTSAVIFSSPTTADKMAGSYAQFPGAWLSLGPDAQTGELVASADHLVLDGALFQQLTFDLAASCLAPVAPFTSASHTQNVVDHNSDGGREPLAQLQIIDLNSVCHLILQIGRTLQEFGVQLFEGRDTLMLATIPHAGPEVDLNIPRTQRRILPLLLHLQESDSPEVLRSRIAQLNEEGWKSAGARTWQMIYRGNVWKALVRYLERMAWCLPGPRTSRYLSGAALITFLPPMTIGESVQNELTGYSVRTMKPLCGGPTIAITQTRTSGSPGTITRMSITGSRKWNDARRLHAFAEALRQRLKTENYQVTQTSPDGAESVAILPLTDSPAARRVAPQIPPRRRRA